MRDDSTAPLSWEALDRRPRAPAEPFPAEFLGREREMVSPGLAGGHLSLRERGAGSLADDLGVDRGVVLSRAAALLRSIESKPSRPVGFARDWTGEPVGRRLGPATAECAGARTWAFRGALPEGARLRLAAPCRPALPGRAERPPRRPRAAGARGDLAPDAPPSGPDLAASAFAVGSTRTPTAESAPLHCGECTSAGDRKLCRFFSVAVSAEPPGNRPDLAASTFSAHPIGGVRFEKKFVPDLRRPVESDRATLANTLAVFNPASAQARRKKADLETLFQTPYLHTQPLVEIQFEKVLVKFFGVNFFFLTGR